MTLQLGSQHAYQLTLCQILLIHYIRGGKSVCYHGPHELYVIAGGPKNHLILS